MITNQQLVDKAHSAIENYRRIYRRFPVAVGIDHRRLAEMQITSIAFPILNDSLPIPFLPVVGTKISPDEVYVRGSADSPKAVSGAAIARLCNLIKIRRERTLYAPLHLRLESSKSSDEIEQDLGTGLQFKQEFYGIFID